jgi:hypothetical protein
MRKSMIDEINETFLSLWMSKSLLLSYSQDREKLEIIHSAWFNVVLFNDRNECPPIMTKPLSIIKPPFQSIL